MQRIRRALLVLVALVFAGCSGSAGMRDDIGRLTLSLQGQSLDGVDRAFIEISQLRLDRLGASSFTYNYDPPRIIILNRDSNGRGTILLDRQTVAAGMYAGVRLVLNPAQNGADSFAEAADGTVSPLRTPDGNHTLMVSQPFNVPPVGDEEVIVRISLQEQRTAENTGTGSVFPILHLVARHRDRTQHPLRHRARRRRSAA